MRCEPANTIISKLGGLTIVSRVVDGTPNGVMRWRMEKRKGGTGGRVPNWHIPKLLAYAAENALHLTLDEFFPSQGQSSSGNKSTAGSYDRRAESPVNSAAAPAREAAR